MEKHWILEKFTDSTSLYGICPQCGFWYCMCDTINADNGKLKAVVFNYCPYCGEHLTLDEAAPNCGMVWNEHTMEEYRKEFTKNEENRVEISDSGSSD